MPISDTLQQFRADVAQCDSLIANAHKTDSTGSGVLPTIDQQQITVAAFLNMYIAWETFLESAIIEFMTGASTISGRNPTKYVSPQHSQAARQIIAGVRAFF